MSTPVTVPRRRFGLSLVLLAMAGLIGFQLMSARKAPVPAAFAAGYTLADAQQRSAESGKPVFVFATADWCPPCQVLKRQAMADERVNSWLIANTEPVYLDVDQGRADARQLAVGSVPTMMVLKNGSISDRVEGAMTADALLAWLESSVGSN